MTYFNTNAEEGELLEESRRQTERQEEKVLAFFRKNPGKLFSREEINALVMPESPYTSAQRAITNLTTEGHLEKTENKVMGKWGKQVHTWKLKEEVFFIQQEPAKRQTNIWGPQ